MSAVETVRVVNDDAAGGFVIINAADFAPAVHVKWPRPKPRPVPAPPAPPPAPAPVA